MPWGAAAAAVGAIGGAVISSKGAKDAAKEAREGQENAAAIIADSADQAREDIYTIFPNAQATSTAGFQAAFDAIGAAAPQQVSAFLQGNQQAQGIIGQGQQQYQNAILGLGTDTSYLQPQQIDYDSSWMQDIVPELRAPENRFGEAAGVVGSPVFNNESDAAIDNGVGVGTEVGDAAAEEAEAAANAMPEFLQGINTTEQLWSAAASGVIPGLNAGDAEFFGALLADMRGSHGVYGNQWIEDPEQVRKDIVGVQGGLASANELPVERLLDAITGGSTYTPQTVLDANLLKGF